MKEEIKRVKSQAKVNKLNWQKEVNNKIDNLSDRIVLTIKDWKSKDLDSEEIYEVISKCTSVILYNDLDVVLRDKALGKDKIYITHSIDFLKIVKDFTITDFKILAYIINKLELGSNKFKCDYDDLANYLEISTGAAYVAMNNFISKYNSVVIQKTNASGVFIINHNIIFNGNPEVFNSFYVALHGNNIAEVDDRGRAIIK